MVTAHGLGQRRGRGDEARRHDYFRKPFEPDELLAVANRALDAARLRVDNERLATLASLSWRGRWCSASAAMSRLAVLVQRRRRAT